MKFGMPTLVECNDLYNCVKVAREHKLDFIEINTSFPNYNPRNLDVDFLLDAKRDGLFYTIHADEGLNPFDFHPMVSECYFDIMREHIALAKKLGVPVINMHLMKGVYVTLPEKVILLTDVYKEEYIENVKRFIKMCEEEIGDSGVKIAIENVDSNPFTKSQIEALEYFMDSDVFALTLDVGHDDCLGGKDYFVFEKYKDKLIHMHLHDSDGKHAHLPLGEGKVDVLGKIGLLSGDKTCLVEVKTVAGLEVSLEFLRKNGVINK